MELLPGLDHDPDSISVVERTIAFVEMKTKGQASLPIDPVYPAFRQDASTLSLLLAVLNPPGPRPPRGFLRPAGPPARPPLLVPRGGQAPLGLGLRRDGRRRLWRGRFRGGAKTGGGRGTRPESPPQQK